MEFLEEKETAPKRILAGFDGFVDEVIHVVRKRTDRDHYECYRYLRDYGEAIASSGGLNLNVEMLPVRRKIGGNGVQMAEALARLGESVIYIGACGLEGIDPVFHDFEKLVTLYSISDPARTDAIEFADGKIISSRLKALENVSWDSVLARIGREKMTALAQEADGLAFGNWASVLTMTELWRSFLAETAPEIRSGKRLFLDLSNPAKRTGKDVLEALGCIRGFGRYFRVTLGLNRKELACLSGFLRARKNGQTDAEPDAFITAAAEQAAVSPETLVENAQFLLEELGLDTITVHNARGSFAISGGEKKMVETPYCPAPLQMTGAGDHYNAGFVFGQMHGCSLEQTLRLATASSGFYIRTGKSAGREDLAGFFRQWEEGSLT